MQMPPMNPQFLQALMAMMQQQQGYGKAQADPFQREGGPTPAPPSGGIYAGGPTPAGGGAPDGGIYAGGPTPRYLPQPQPPMYPGGYQTGVKPGSQMPPWQVGHPMSTPPWMTRPAQMPPSSNEIRNIQNWQPSPTPPGPYGGIHWQGPAPNPGMPHGMPAPPPMPMTMDHQYGVGGGAGGGVSEGGDGGGPTVDFSSIKWPQMSFNSSGYRPMEAHRPDINYGPPPMPGGRGGGRVGMPMPRPNGGNGGPSGGYTGW